LNISCSIIGNSVPEFYGYPKPVSITRRFDGNVIVRPAPVRAIRNRPHIDKQLDLGALFG